jgi:hypothetical protein
MLADGENISVGIFEPGNFVAAGSRPDSCFFIIHPGIFLESDPALLKFGDFFFYVRNLPAEDGEWGWSEIGFGDSDHGFAGPQDQRELVFADELKSDFAFVKASGLRGIFGGNETDDLARSQHWEPSVSLLSWNDNICRPMNKTLYNPVRLRLHRFEGSLLFFATGGFTMSHFARLQWIGRVTYYAGWIALLCGGLMHFNIARNLFLAINISKRNLFEIGLVCFLVCIASQIRAREEVGAEMTSGLRKAA